MAGKYTPTPLCASLFVKVILREPANKYKPRETRLRGKERGREKETDRGRERNLFDDYVLLQKNAVEDSISNSDSVVDVFLHRPFYLCEALIPPVSRS